jgi:hypothetical protein
MLSLCGFTHAQRTTDHAPAARAVADASPSLRTQSVFLIMLDGVRWQEVFTGLDESLCTKAAGKVEKPGPLLEKFGGATPEERRAKLMPFLWSTVAKHGQLFGNKAKGSSATITNPFRVSYPGYSETFCGFADPTIENNRKLPNPNTTVFEFLNQQSAFKGKVAAIATWDLFEYIFNEPRSGIVVINHQAPVSGTSSPALDLLTRLRQETPPRWSGNTFDSLIFHTAKEWIAANTPRVVFLGFGEPDEWGHEGNYGEYLTSIRRCDDYVRELWDALQRHDIYKDATTFILLPDHGRGDHRTSPTDWNNHGTKHPGSEDIWIAVLGPDTPALGERREVADVTQSQVAATLAALLGHDYAAAQPKAGKPITDVLPVSRAP